ncbi:syntaxin-binding protein 4 isoform X2 [Xenopus tropicalis]|uniref:Syntaxin-binding protein 4 isoform X2 n=1 Tax=Xenopus tropicalis TaxID=8364 RepID=A0A8J1IV53_XENTR|nr:syntaxin-binding protein 4 isoform X2 [Xenopus tropicalis]
MSYLRPSGKELERFDGLSLIYWTLMGPYGIDRTVYCMEFNDCVNGLGIKVIGGVRELSREEYGVYVKRILPGGIAYSDGRLQAGDQILEVNGDSLLGVSSERAVDILRTASASSYMRLLIARDDEARKEFSELMEKYGSSHSDTSSARSSPIMQGSRYLESTSSESSSRSQSPLLLSPGSSHGQFTGSSSLSPHSTMSDSGMQNISVAKSTGLGLVISGGSNRPEGPMVYVQEVLVDGDCSRDGRLRAGDQLVSINRETLVGVTNEEAKRVLARSRFRQGSFTEVSFIPAATHLPGLSGANSAMSSPQRILGNGLPSCRLKVHVRSPECRNENHMLSPSPDICPPELTVSAPVSPPNQRAYAGNKQKVSLDPHVRLKEEKVELILQFLGLDVSEEKRKEVHQGLITDCQGTVAYGDILRAMREGLQEELEEAGLDYSSLLFTHYQVANLLDTSAFQSPVTKEIELPRFSESLELEQLQEEVTDLRQEVRRLKVLLREAENSKRATEDELQRLNQKVLGLLSENRCLQSKLQVAELAQREAHSAEHDYEEVIHLLEAEISELKGQMAGKKKLSLEVPEGLDLNRRLSLSDCQLRKSELSRRQLEVSNKKLLNFVQKIQNILSTSLQFSEGKRSRSRDSESDVNVSVPSAESLVTEVTDILESCFACPYPGTDFQRYNRSAYSLGASSQNMVWPSPPTPTLVRDLSGSGEDLLCATKEPEDKPTE